MTIEASEGNGACSPASADPSKPKFRPNVRTQTTPDIHVPGEVWLTVLDSPCTFGPGIFDQVMLNLIKNPNITSTHLFRADVFFDSSKHAPISTSATADTRLGNHLKAEYQPRLLDVPGWRFDKVLVRKLVPRNPQLDRPLLQTCTYLSRCHEDRTTETLVVYIPHIDRPDDMPFYHPRVEKLAFYHSYQSKPSPLGPGTPNAKISVSYKPFQELSSETITNKLDRTALKLLQTVHKHGQGQLAGYEKRVHHDQVIPQQRYQDTYTRLKRKYGRKLSEGWVEITDPSKHVFEDLGIAAFLLELWAEMYEKPATAGTGEPSTEGAIPRAVTLGAVEEVRDEVVNLSIGDCPDIGSQAGGSTKPPFPGFVDIGCGNGLLVYILISEGYPGFGFDARERKTWSTFPPNVREQLQQRLLVPEVLFPPEQDTISPRQSWHDGVFTEGRFILSNHADELTAWTPLLAYLRNSAFIAIPCCSHDLTGSRFRAPEYTKALKPGKGATDREHPGRLPQQATHSDHEDAANGEAQAEEPKALHMTQAAETGSLKRTLVQKKMASAYSTLCSYVTSLATTVGFEPEQEVLRIPSTRNQSIIGRQRKGEAESYEVRKAKVRNLLEEELNKSLYQIGKEWIERAELLSRKPGSGH